MFKLFITLTISTCLLLTAQGQSKQELFAKVDSLRSALLRADTLNPFNNDIDNIYDTIDAVHQEISNHLAAILTNKLTLSLNLDSLLDFPSLGKVRSKDERLWIFNWYENTGGSWKSNISLVHYRTKDKKLKLDSDPNVYEEQTEENAQQNIFCSNGASFNKIYKLNAKGKDLYLCLGSGISCNTCIYDIASVVELTKDSINFNYPAFEFVDKEDLSPQGNSQACFTLEARWGNIEAFEFDPKTQVLTLAYLTDDNTPVQSVKQRRVVRRLHFDGVKFRGNAYK